MSQISTCDYEVARLRGTVRNWLCITNSQFFADICLDLNVGIRLINWF